MARTAWDMIGWDNGKIRIVGGRAVYEAVMYDCAHDGRLVKLARLEVMDNGVREVSRYVKPDTLLEVVEAPSVHKASENHLAAPSIP